MIGGPNRSGDGRFLDNRRSALLESATLNGHGKRLKQFGF